MLTILFGIGYRDDVAGAVLPMRARYGELRKAVMSEPPSREIMCARYLSAIEQALARRKAA